MHFVPKSQELFKRTKSLDTLEQHMRLKDTNLEKDRKMTFNFKVDCTINSEHSPVFDSFKVYAYLVIKATSF